MIASRVNIIILVVHIMIQKPPRQISQLNGRVPERVYKRDGVRLDALA